eukprot:3860760-Rhodomonas_salina.2
MSNDKEIRARSSSCWKSETIAVTRAVTAERLDCCARWRARAALATANHCPGPHCDVEIPLCSSLGYAGSGLCPDSEEEAAALKVFANRSRLAKHLSRSNFPFPHEKNLLKAAEDLCLSLSMRPADERYRVHGSPCPVVGSLQLQRNRGAFLTDQKLPLHVPAIHSQQHVSLQNPPAQICRASPNHLPDTYVDLAIFVGLLHQTQTHAGKPLRLRWGPLLCAPRRPLLCQDKLVVLLRLEEAVNRKWSERTLAPRLARGSARGSERTLSPRNVFD